MVVRLPLLLLGSPPDCLHLQALCALVPYWTWVPQEGQGPLATPLAHQSEAPPGLALHIPECEIWEVPCQTALQPVQDNTGLSVQANHGLQGGVQADCMTGHM